jgi:hypothetical protein
MKDRIYQARLIGLIFRPFEWINISFHLAEAIKKVQNQKFQMALDVMKDIQTALDSPIFLNGFTIIFRNHDISLLIVRQ